MAERIPEATLAEIRARTNIVEVISGYVALSKSGRNYMGLCPFHGEKTPSFSVNEERGFFHCFGCNESGNAFTFLSKIDGLTFPEAVRYLAQRAGVSLPDSRDPQAQERARLYRLNEMAAVYFQRCLAGTAGATARQYLKERGLQPDIVTQFRLGYAPPWSGGLVRFLSDQRADLSRAASLGLIGKRESGGYYDKFRQRLMFPITDVVGQPVGFGGRILPQADGPQNGESTHNVSRMNGQLSNNRPTRPLPKYINSSDSLLYKKGSLLYGLAQAKTTIQSCSRVLVVEGYVDLLALVQYGHAEAVAVLGTALTAEQLKLVRRFTREVYFFFDGDEAGLRAASRSFPLCVEAEVRGWGVFLPEGEDPDSFVRAHGLTALDALIAQAEPLEDFYFRRHTPPTGASAFERSQAAREAMVVLKPMKDIVARGALLSQIAERFGVREEDLRRVDSAPEESRVSSYGDSPRQASYKRVSNAGQQASRSQPQRRESRETAPQRTVETELIFLMLIDRRLALRAAAEDVISAFQQWGSLAAEILASWQGSEPHNEQGQQNQYPQIDIGIFLGRLPKGLADRVSRAYGQEVSSEESEQREQLFSDCLRRIQTTQRKSARERLQQEIREAEQKGDEAGVRLRLQQLQNWDTARSSEKQ